MVDPKANMDVPTCYINTTENGKSRTEITQQLPLGKYQCLLILPGENTRDSLREHHVEGTPVHCPGIIGQQ